MSSAPKSPESSVPEIRLGATPYERVASTLIAALILLGGAVLAMFIVMLTMRALVRREYVPVAYVDESLGRGDHEAGTERDAKNSQVDELDEFFPPEMEETILTVSDIVATDVAMLESLDTQLTNFGASQGKGDSRQAGPLGEGEDVVPRWERWQVRFASADINAYARQLDFFGIELAAMGGGKETVDYATKLSAPKPMRRSGPAADEKRLYMTWRSGELIDADRQLLAKAGIDTSGRLILQFYPPAAERLLEQLEQKQAGNRELKQIKRTVFGVRGAGDKYEFYVISQDYRAA